MIDKIYKKQQSIVKIMLLIDKETDPAKTKRLKRQLANKNRWLKRYLKACIGTNLIVPDLVLLG